MKIGDAIAKRIYDLLAQQDKSQYRIKKEMAIPHSTWINLTRAKNQAANIKTIFQVCKGMNISVSAFFDDPIFERDDLEID
jgi:predicted XRE-type DNA-binding protein